MQYQVKWLQFIKKKKDYEKYLLWEHVSKAFSYCKINLAAKFYFFIAVVFCVHDASLHYTGKASINIRNQVPVLSNLIIFRIFLHSIKKLISVKIGNMGVCTLARVLSRK